MSLDKHRWVLVGLAAAGVVVVQASTASMWWTPAAGVPILLTDALLVAGLLGGVAAERWATGSSRASGDGPAARTESAVVFGLIALVAAVLGGAACVRFATTSESLACGSPLYPSDYDCVPIAGTIWVVATAIVTMISGGSAIAALRNGPRVTLPRPAEVGGVIVGVVLMGGALAVVPRSYPSAPSQALALAEMTQDVRLAVGFLVLAVTVLCALAHAHHNANQERPVLTILIGLFCAAIAGVAVATVWISALADYMKGP